VNLTLIKKNDTFKSYEVGWYSIIFLSVAYGIISVLSVIGNGLIILAVLTNKRMRNVTNYFINNLALSDIVVGLFATPFQVFFIYSHMFFYKFKKKI
jgi:hypothetical protein